MIFERIALSFAKKVLSFLGMAIDLYAVFKSLNH